MNWVLLIPAIVIVHKKIFFGALTLTKKADVDKYSYSGYGIGFGGRSSASFGQNVLILGGRYEFYCSYW